MTTSSHGPDWSDIWFLLLLIPVVPIVVQAVLTAAGASDGNIALWTFISWFLCLLGGQALLWRAWHANVAESQVRVVDSEISGQTAWPSYRKVSVRLDQLAAVRYLKRLSVPSPGSTDIPSAHFVVVRDRAGSRMMIELDGTQELRARVLEALDLSPAAYADPPTRRRLAGEKEPRLVTFGGVLLGIGRIAAAASLGGIATAVATQVIA